MGFPNDYEIGRSFAAMEQERRKLIFSSNKNLVVKILGYKRRQESPTTDSDLEPVTYLNGFFYSDSDPYILTCAHAFDSGATDFFACMSDGSAFNARVPIELVKSGQRQQIPPENARGEWVPDVAVFKCPQQPAHPPRPHGSVATTGDSAYVIGFAGPDAPQLSFKSGTVSSVGFMGGARSPFGSFTIDTYAEPGYSGSPILDIDGFLIGMVQAGHDPDGSKQVTAIPAQGINVFLHFYGSALPGIKS
ncbi:hypothetical protein PLESTB_000114700 [Pleodorina starrii]|uniref:Serine protease n=1 Tax=Pleodorina starrii TaxID=330485 RepID=A0A9W6BBN9_9CHLO|nr:hypothetical protein PLESTM_000110300 [Pleodorina starrii]GLC48591.1 hypothetical protein PLESTB_000114700 [Pleodorina starrii]